MSEEIPQWAIERAREEIGENFDKPEIFATFARHIAQHEQPPVDPDIAIVSLTLQAFYNAGAGAMHTTNENSAPFQAALATYRKHKEVGK